ncbi:MAG TPA: 2-nitropropane dioxygenase, partial [Bacillus bacterium]|nr:2-nitropropane dioxygenase [Bacillus sp. (in: firmicutes)]
QIIRHINIPVVAAGGIGDGKGLAAMLALGASGVQMGTRFIATQEAPFHEAYKQKVLQANDHETVIVGRSIGRIRRLLNTPYAEKLLEAENQGITAEEFSELTSEDIHKKGAIEGNMEGGFMNGGQVAGLIADIPPVNDLLERMIKEAKEQLLMTIKLL